MTNCPKCNRAYSENFSYCLDDGTPLSHSTFDEATLVMQQPQPTEPRPAPTAPVTTQQRSVLPIILGVAGVIVLVLLVGGIGFGVWFLNRDPSGANQNSNSAPAYSTSGPSPSSNTNPLTIGNSNSNPAASPSSSIEVPNLDSVISPGTYECEVTRTVGEATKHTVAIRLQVTVNDDGTYSTKGYMTLAEANINNQLGMEERGNYSQSENTLVLSNRREREYDFETGSWKRWRVPEDGSESREKVRNVSANAFELYDEDERVWYALTKV